MLHVFLQQERMLDRAATRLPFGGGPRPSTHSQLYRIPRVAMPRGIIIPMDVMRMRAHSPCVRK